MLLWVATARFCVAVMQSSVASSALCICSCERTGAPCLRHDGIRARLYYPSRHAACVWPCLHADHSSTNNSRYQPLASNTIPSGVRRHRMGRRNLHAVCLPLCLHATYSSRAESAMSSILRNFFRRVRARVGEIYRSRRADCFQGVRLVEFAVLKLARRKILKYWNCETKSLDRRMRSSGGGRWVAVHCPAVSQPSSSTG